MRFVVRKSLIFIIVFTFPGAHKAISQESEIGSNKLFLEIGTPYVPIDWMGGILIGAGARIGDSRYNISVKKIWVFRISRDSRFSPSYQAYHFNERFYFDLNYQIGKVSEVSLGYLWIYGGQMSNNMFNNASGYQGASLAYRFTLQWLTMESRVDIPFISWNDSKIQPPIVLSFFYRLVPATPSLH